MNNRRIKILDDFMLCLRDLPDDIVQGTKVALKQYIERSAENSLRPEYKNGLDVWAIRITKGYRAFFMRHKDDNGRIDVFFHVGPHDDYRSVKRLRPRL